MNSFKSIERALEYEVSRQIEMAEKGTPIIQSTLRWDDVEGKTYLMRTKENAQDYRYFTESDLSMINVSEELITGIEKTLPELLSDKKKRYVEELKLSDKQILFILSDNRYIDLFEKTLEKTTALLGETPPQDVQATLLEFTVQSIALALNQLETPLPRRLLVCGGGAKNGLLMARLQALLPQWQCLPTNDEGLDVDYVEAAAFAWLGYRRIHNQPSNLPSVTGAQRAVSLGAIFPAEKQA